MWVNLVKLQFFFLVFDPKSRIFGVSEFLFGLIIGLFIIKVNRIDKKILSFYLLYFFIPIIYGLFISCFTNKTLELYYVKQNIIRGIFGTIIFPISLISKKKLEKLVIDILNIYSKILIFFWMILFILINLKLGSVIRKLNLFGNSKDIFIVYQIKLGNLLLPNIFTGINILLVFLFAYLLFNKRVKQSIIIFLLLIQNTTAANTLSAILILIYYLYSKYLKKFTLKLKILLFILCGLVGIFLFKKIIFFSGDAGNSIKWLHLISYIKLWQTNLISFIIGEGIGTGIYTLAYNKEIFMTELFYFEIIRIYGILIFLLIIYCLWKILNNLIVIKNEWLMISFLAYLGISGTNPYLFGVMGSFIISIIFILSLNKGKRRNNNKDKISREGIKNERNNTSRGKWNKTLSNNKSDIKTDKSNI